MENFQNEDELLKANPLLQPSGHVHSEPTDEDLERHTKEVERENATKETVVIPKQRTASGRATMETAVIEKPEPGNAIVDLPPDDAYDWKVYKKMTG
ncbi:MAG: hypothetical protein PHS53_04985, partial [Candidatus Pacebacteria bacterium]|nr:hypothetical protein [Candidatus Paceibacterota bacterium]